MFSGGKYVKQKLFNIGRIFKIYRDCKQQRRLSGL